MTERQRDIDTEKYRDTETEGDGDAISFSPFFLLSALYFCLGLPHRLSFTRAPTFNQKDKDLIYFVHPLYNILMYLIDISSGIELLYNNAKGSFGGYVTGDVI